MEFLTLPPEVTSVLMHSGPGAGSLLDAATAWRRLGTDLEESARDYASAMASLTGRWRGPSATAMVQAAQPYLNWLRTTAQQCQQTSSSAQAAAAAFYTASAAMVPAAQVTANRARQAQLLASNRFGNNLPAIAETDDQYQRMWTNNASAMGRYQAASAQATTLPQFATPTTVTHPNGLAASASTTSAAPATASSASSMVASATGFDPNSGWFGLANTYANQFVSSGFPINLLSYLAQNTSAQALQSVDSAIGEGLTEGEAALAPSAGALGALGAAGLSAQPAAAMGVGVSVGKLTAPPAVVGLLPASSAPVQLASAASPLAAGGPGLPPLMPPPVSAGSGWRKRKPQKYEDLERGAELKGPVIPRSPSAG